MGKQKCPFFGKCGGCKLDFTADDYRAKKQALLKKIPVTGDAVWIADGVRRRADMAFAGGEFGFFEMGTKNIIPVRNCPNLCEEINNIILQIAKLPWCGAGSCLITKCDNGIDIAITSNVDYFSPEFRDAMSKQPVVRATWNGKIIKQTEQPVISFNNTKIDYPTGAFLQPSIEGADALRNKVCDAATGYKKVADLFCGLGNFTFALNADGFDIVGTGVKRDLFKKPLTVGMLKNYDCVVMDPPRAGADAQCKELIKSDVKRIIYVSCNPATFMRDAQTLKTGNYLINTLIPVDQFVGSGHWELFAIFDKE